MAKAKATVNVLFTSAGRRVELIRAFRRAYDELGIDGTIIALDIDPLAPALSAADRRYLVPRLSSSDYVDRLVEICQRERVDLVFPLIDPDIPLLADHREVVEATGARLAVVPRDAAEICADKWLTMAFFRHLGLATPATWLPEQFDLDGADYPVFIKPRMGSASQNTFRADSPKQAAFFLDYVPDPVVQEFIAGPEITTDVVCGVDGSLLGIVSRQRISVRSGEVLKGVTVRDPAIIEACHRIAAGLPALGPVTVQCMLRDGEPLFTEINARFGGGLPLGIAAGVNAPLLLLARAAGVETTEPQLGVYEVGLSMTRFDDSFFISEAQRNDLARHHL